MDFLDPPLVIIWVLFTYVGKLGECTFKQMKSDFLEEGKVFRTGDVWQSNWYVRANSQVHW